MELGGYENIYEVTTKYNNISSQASNNRKRMQTA